MRWEDGISRRKVGRGGGREVSGLWCDVGVMGGEGRVKEGMTDGLGTIKRIYAVFYRHFRGYYVQECLKKTQYQFAPIVNIFT